MVKDMITAYKFLSGRLYDRNIACQFVIPTPEVAIFYYFKSTFVVICANVILVTVYCISIWYSLPHYVLNANTLVFSRIDWIIFGVI